MPESYWKFVEPLFDTVVIDDPKAFSVSIADVPRPELLLFAAHFCLSEVHNGGLLQFFWNSTGLLAPEAAEGFRAIGMNKLAALLTEAITTLGSPYPRDRDERWDALLVASNRTENELKQIFEGSSNFHLAFQKATATIGLDAMTKSLYDLAKTESGGFQEAADRYAETLDRVE